MCGESGPFHSSPVLKELELRRQGAEVAGGSLGCQLSFSLPTRTVRSGQEQSRRWKAQTAKGKS